MIGALAVRRGAGIEARRRQCTLSYTQVPDALRALAHLSEVEALIAADGQGNDKGRS